MNTPYEIEIGHYIAREMLKQPNRILAPDEALISSGLVDSFHLMDLALFVEGAWGVEIHDSELNAATFDNLRQLAALIRQRRGE